jgi:hypothetical protein
VHDKEVETRRKLYLFFSSWTSFQCYYRLLFCTENIFINMVLDPLSAIGLAGTVAQFIDFSMEIISESRKIYRSGTGTSSENVELETIAESLHQFSMQLQTSKDGQIPVPNMNAAFAKVLQSCQGVADELLQALRRLKVKDGPHKRWNSFQQALMSIWRKERLSEMQRRLGFLREQVTLHLVSSVRSDYLF